MKALLICPADRAEVAHLAETFPLAIAPLLGKSVLEYWLEALVARGVKHVTVLASDRPQEVRAVTGNGARWGISLEVVTQTRELSVEQARAKYFSAASDATRTDHEVILLDHLPGQPEHPLFDSYASWFAAVQAFLPHAVTPARIGAREVQPKIWVGLHTQIAPTAQLRAPCWIGDDVHIGPDAVIGPGAILEDRVVIERSASVTQSVIGPDTFVGKMISVSNSVAHGDTIVSWINGSCLRVPDAFFLCSLRPRNFAHCGPSFIGRVLALVALVVTAPVAIAMMAWSLVRGENLLVLRLGVRPQRNMRGGGQQTFAYYELAGSSNWLHRWPQFWSIVRGDLCWVGNRPLRPTQVLSLTNDFERLWLAAPPGIVSLADAQGCLDELSEETCAHASYYAVNASRRLDWFVLSRALFRAALAWPIRWTRRKDVPALFRQILPKQEV
jgi:hypothetical protein